MIEDFEMYEEIYQIAKNIWILPLLESEFWDVFGGGKTN